VTALAIIGGIAIGAWFRPLPDNKAPSAQSAPTYTDQQVSDAKANVCAAYQKVHHAVILATTTKYGDDQVAKQVVADSSWIAFDNGSLYLSTILADEPATPSDLTQSVRKLAKLYQLLALDYMTEASHSELDSALRTGDEVTATIERLCK
jgi:hypothetical protein